jgi:uracil-DNA glycosylase family 4
VFTDCKACHLGKTSKAVGPDGDPESGFFVIAEAPGGTEVRTGRPLDGLAGKAFDEKLVEAGIDRGDLFVLNTVFCLPPKTRPGGVTPTPDEAKFCFDRHARRFIEKLNPRVVLLLGSVAARTMLDSTEPLGKLRGKVHRRDGRSIIVTWHPSYYLRRGKDATIGGEIVSDFKLAKAEYEKPETAGDETDETIGLKLYARHVERTAGADVEDKSERIRNLERRPVEGNNPWHPERKYLSGWSDGTDVVMVWRDENEKKQLERIEFKWYHYVLTEDVEKIPKSVLERAKKRGTVYRIEIEAKYPLWSRVYGQRYITQTRALRDRGEIGVTLNAYKLDKFPKEAQLVDWYKDLEGAGVRHFEGDLSPRQRFMTDNDINIEDSFRELYFDLETEDQAVGFTDISSRRIISIGYIHKRLDGELERGFIKLSSLSDSAEREMLLKFLRVIERSDALYAWNGFMFDFPIIRDRMSKYGIAFDWRLIFWCDLLAVWRRYFQRAAAVNTSFSLNDIGSRVLHKPKLDWRIEVVKLCEKEKCQHPIVKSIFNLWERHPELLEEYNMRDVEILYELEKEHGFAKIEQVFCRIGNCMPSDYHISTKIDMLLLKKGFIEGLHFATRKFAVGELHKRGSKQVASYEGGWVFEPTTGIHTDVAALDFKSLYPSMMVLFNISPDTFVSEESRKNFPPEALLSCPTGTTFLRNTVGFIPQIFAETLQKRKVYQELQLLEEIGSDKFLLYYRLAYAFKRLGLSFYGELGNRESRYYNPKVAEAVTLSGQFFIKETAEFAERNGIKVLYGDSVDGSSIIYLDSAKRPMSIESLWDYLSPLGIHRRGSKEIISVDGIFKTMAGVLRPNAGRWGASRMVSTMAPIVKIIRHKTPKRRFQITTSRGKTLLVTEDHSLVVKRGVGGEYLTIKPTELEPGDFVYSYKPSIKIPNTAKHLEKAKRVFRKHSLSQKRTKVDRPESWGKKIALALLAYHRTNPDAGRINRLKQTMPTENTKPELKCRELLLSLDIKDFEMHGLISNSSFGCRPDFVFRNRKYVLFIDGDYWHANPEFYSEHDKIQIHTVRVDQIQRGWLRKQGYSVYRLWENELIDSALISTIRKLRRWLCS